jgi:hypothetical protein
MGKRNAVETKSGKTVSHSVPGLRRPTLPSTVGLKPTACPPIQSFPDKGSNFQSGYSREASGSQRKNGRGSGQSPDFQARREAPGSFTPAADCAKALPYTFGDSQITALIQFFETLDRWDKEAHGPQVM